MSVIFEGNKNDLVLFFYFGFAFKAKAITKNRWIPSCVNILLVNFQNFLPMHIVYNLELANIGMFLRV